MMTAGPEHSSDDPEGMMISMIEESAKLLEILHKNPETPQFAVDLGVIVPLYLVCTPMPRLNSHSDNSLSR
jgi:hypothetical protein